MTVTVYVFTATTSLQNRKPTMPRRQSVGHRTLIGATDPPGLLRVSSRTDPTILAGKMAHMARESEGREPILAQTIAAGPANQLAKAIAILYSYLNNDGLAPMVSIAFVDLLVDNSERTGLRYTVKFSQRTTHDDTVEASERERLSDIIRVGSRTNNVELAKSLVASIKHHGQFNLIIQTIGAGALNQFFKAVASLSTHIAGVGLKPFLTIRFVDTDVKGDEITALRHFLFAIQSA